LGTSVVPINWHWKADEVRYVLDDSGATAVVGHADLLAGLAAAFADRQTVWQATPPDVTAAFGISAPDAAVPSGQVDYEAWLASHPPLDVATRNAASSGLFYTSGT